MKVKSIGGYNSICIKHKEDDHKTGGLWKFTNYPEMHPSFFDLARCATWKTTQENLDKELDFSNNNKYLKEV